MDLQLNRDNYRTYRAYRALLDEKLTELALYAKELCPEAVVEVSATSYEDEDGHIDIFPPPFASRGRGRAGRAGSCCPGWRHFRGDRTLYSLCGVGPACEAVVNGCSSSIITSFTSSPPFAMGSRKKLG